MRKILRVSFAVVCMGVLTLYLFDGIVFSSQGEALSYEEFTSDKERLAKFRDQMANMGLNEAELPRIYQQYMAQYTMAQPASSTSKRQPSAITSFKDKMGKAYAVLARPGRHAASIARKIGWDLRGELIGMAIGFGVLVIGIAGLTQLALILERKARS